MSTSVKNNLTDPVSGGGSSGSIAGDNCALPSVDLCSVTLPTKVASGYAEPSQKDLQHLQEAFAKFAYVFYAALKSQLNSGNDSTAEACKVDRSAPKAEVQAKLSLFCQKIESQSPVSPADLIEVLAQIESNVNWTKLGDENKQAFKELKDATLTLSDFTQRTLQGYRHSDSSRLDVNNESYDLEVRALGVIADKVKEHVPSLQAITASLLKKEPVAVKTTYAIPEVQLSKPEIVQGAGCEVESVMQENKPKREPQSFWSLLKTAAKKPLYVMALCVVVSLRVAIIALKIPLRYAMRALVCIFGNTAEPINPEEPDQVQRSRASVTQKPGSFLSLLKLLTSCLENLLDDYACIAKGEHLASQRLGKRRLTQTGAESSDAGLDEDASTNDSGWLSWLRKASRSNGRSTIHVGKIYGSIHKLSRFLSVSEPFVVVGKNGELQRLDQFLQSVAHLPDAPKESEIYMPRSLGVLKSIKNPSGSEHAICHIPVVAGRTISLPHPTNYSPVALVFLDSKEQVIEPPSENGWPVRECIFGSTLVEVPMGARSVAYELVPNDTKYFKLNEVLVEKLNAVLPRFSTYRSEEENCFRQAIDIVTEDKGLRMRLALEHEKNRGFVYIKDPFVSKFQDSSGSAFAEAIGGMRLGLCDSMSYYMALIGREYEQPAVVLSGPVVDADSASFKVSPGHSVTGFIASDHMDQVDLTQYSKQDDNLNRFTLTPKTRREALLKLAEPGLTNQQVYEEAEKIGNLMRGLGEDGTSPSSKIDAYLLRNTPRILNRFLSTETEKHPHLDSGLHSSDLTNPKVDAYSSLTKTIAYYLNLQRLYKKALSDGNFDKLLNKVFDNSEEKPAALKPVPRGMLPRWCRILIRNKADKIQWQSWLTRKIIKDIRENKISREVAQSIIDRLIVNSGTLGVRVLGSKKYVTSPVPIRDLRLLADEKVLSIMSASQLIRVQESVILQMEGVDWETSNSKLLAPAACLRKFSQALCERVKAGDVKDSESCAKLLMAEVSLCRFAVTYAQHVKERINKGRLKDGDWATYWNNITTTIENNSKALSISPMQTLLSLLKGDDNLVNMAAFYVYENGLKRLDGYSPSEANNLDLSAIIARLIETHLHQGYEYDYAALFYELERLGFKLDLAPYADKLEARLIPLVKKIGKESLTSPRGKCLNNTLSTHLNIPALHTPASKIVVNLASDRFAFFLSAISSIIERGGLSYEKVARVWPAADEGVVAKYLAQRIGIFRFGEASTLASELKNRPSPPKGCLLRIASDPDPTRQPYVRLAKLKLLSENLIPKKFLPFIDYLSVRHYYNHPLENAFEQFRKVYPNEFSDLFSLIKGSAQISTLATDTLRIILEGQERSELYHAVLWLLAQLAIEFKKESPSHSTASRLAPVQASTPLLLLAATPPEEESQFAEIISDAGIVRGDGIKLFDSVSPKAKMQAMFIYRYFMAQEGDTPSGLVTLEKITKIPIRILKLLDRYNVEQGKSPLNQIWSLLHTEVSSNLEGYSAFCDLRELPVEIVLNKAERKIRCAMQQAQARIKTPYSTYLIREGGLIMPQAQSGNFEEFVDYRAGDDASRIDWKASSRLGERLVMRKMREEETRKLTLVLDMEWLFDLAYDQQGQAKVELREDRLEKVFVHLLLAQREKIPSDLVLCMRNAVARYQDVVRITPENRKGELFTGRVLFDLKSNLFAASKLLEAEIPLYEMGKRPGFNLFADGDIQPARNGILVNAIHPRNLTESLPALELFKHKQRFVHVIRE